MSVRQVPPTPALVLAIGQLASETVAEGELIFLRGDRRRASTTSFLALGKIGEGQGQPKFILVPLKQALTSKISKSQDARQSYQDFISAASNIRAALEVALHNLRTHERLLEVGLGDKPALPLDVILLADLTDPMCAVLFPLAVILQSLLTHEPYGKGHLLLSTAVFSPQGTNRQTEAQLYTHIQTLEALFAARRNTVKDQLASALGMTELLPPLPFSCYLFDCYKEGTWEVKDEAELKIILGNFLLALLSGGLAQQLSPAAPQPDILDRQAYYSGAAATALVFDPQALSRACAARLGAEIIVEEFGPQVPADPRLGQIVTDELMAQMPTPRDWLKRLIAGIPYELSPTGDLRLNIHFADLRFEDVPIERWVQSILDYDESFEKTRFPDHQAALQTNAEELCEEMQSRLTALIEALPQQPRLYPGGLAASRQVLQNMAGLFEEHQRLFSSNQNGAAYTATFTAALQTLDQAIAALPKPPLWINRLPLPLKTIAISIFTLLFLRREHQRLILLRQQCVRSLEQKVAAALEEIAGQRLAGLCQQLLEAIAQAEESLQRLENILDRVRKRLAREWKEFPPAASIFRPSAVDKAVAGWAFSHWRQPAEKVRTSLLSDHGFLREWREATVRDLEMRLLDFGGEVYQSLWELGLDDILPQRSDKDAEALITILAQGAVPLLRPNFDRIGGSSASYQTRHLLCADPQASIFTPSLRKDLGEWQSVATGDAYLALCCRVRHMIPLAALHELLQAIRPAA